MWPFSDNSWKEIASDKQAARDKAIQHAAVRLTQANAPESSQYLRLTATEIVEGIKAGKWTAKQVMEAYISRAIVAQRETNCLTEILFEDALLEAEKLDLDFARTKVLKGPLHGVPISIKDQYDIAGYDTCVGFSQWTNKPKTEDAFVVSQVRSLGGIILAKTNVPQTLISFECSNPVWGVSTNPYSKAHTCGGSSGGEGAILAMDGSALGFGTDIGGSLRIPAHYSGIYSIKPGWGRVGNKGVASPVPGFHNVLSVAGPMARSVADVKLACKLLFGQSPSHTGTSYPPVPYREHKLAEKLHFGYYLSDEVIKASPVCQRAVLETVAALRKQGHECTEFVPPQVVEALVLFVTLMGADGYKTATSWLGPDPTEKSLFLLLLGPKMPGFVRWLAAKAIEIFKGDYIFSQAMRNARPQSTQEEWNLMAQKEAYITKFYREVWDKHGFDGVIAPVQASPAVPHGATSTLTPLAVGTFLYNLVDSPVACLPVTRVDPAKDGLSEEWRQGPGHGSPLLEETLYTKGVYDVEKMSGLPVGVQIVGRQWEDEKVLEMMEVVDRALGPRGFGPGSWKSSSETEAWRQR